MSPLTQSTLIILNPHSTKIFQVCVLISLFCLGIIFTNANYYLYLNVRILIVLQLRLNIGELMKRLIQFNKIGTTRYYVRFIRDKIFLCLNDSIIGDPKMIGVIPRGLASQKQCTQALSLISLNTLNAFLHNFLIIPFSHHALLDTHNPPLLICTSPFSHHHGVPKYTHFTHMTLRLAQK